MDRHQTSVQMLRRGYNRPTALARSPERELRIFQRSVSGPLSSWCASIQTCVEHRDLPSRRAADIGGSTKTRAMHLMDHPDARSAIVENATF